jgi:TolA-binding protein
MSTKHTQCPAPEVLAQAASEGVNPLLQKHLRGCKRCKQYLDEEREAKSWLGALSSSSPTAQQHAEARDALLAAAENAQVAAPRSSLWSKALAAAAAIVTISIGASYLLSEEPTPQPSVATLKSEPAPLQISTKGTVFSGDQAKFEHQTSDGDETVRLTEGAITIDVPKLNPGERFRVLVGDTEIEVQGSSFEVVAHEGKLVSLTMIYGEAEIKSEQQLVRVEPGERWISAEQIASAEASTSEPILIPEFVAVELSTSLPANKESKIVKPNTDTIADTQQETFEAALAFYREGNIKAALPVFAEISKSTDPDLAEEASYKYADALFRSKSAETKAAIESFLQRFPASSRVYDARLMLARILVDANAIEDAKQQLQIVAEKGPAALQLKAQNALSAIQQRETKPTQEQ